MAERPTVVLKVGTSSLVDTRTGITQVSALARLAEVSMRLVSAGLQVILVSSGAVGLGCSRLGLKQRPTSVAGKQAAAAVGQVRLMSLYDDVFSVLGLRCAQVLLTYDTFGDRTQYLNARNTFNELLRFGAIPVVNENDTIATQEIRVGDNDTLSALVAAMVGAQWLMLLTDVEALYTANPRDLPTASPIRVVPTQHIHSLRRQMHDGVSPMVVGDYTPSARTEPQAASGDAGAGGGAGSQWGTGGMATKLKAAQLATAAGVGVLITCTANIEKVEVALTAAAAAAGWASREGGVSSRSVSPARGAGGAASAPAQSQRAAAAATDAEPATSAASSSAAASSPFALFVDRSIGTTFLPAPKPVTGRKRWILSLASQGTLVLDAGAVAAVRDARKSLFPAGVKAVEGEWETQDSVALVTTEGVEMARALMNYDSESTRKLAGHRSSDIAEVLGQLGPESLADRDNIVILDRASGARQGHGDA